MPGFRREVVVEHVAIVMGLVIRRLSTVVLFANHDPDNPVLHFPGVIEQPVGVVDFDTQSLREEIPVGATLF
ncbi:hypothetical protein A5676_04385 [Mycobacterium malmoense]|nr:hypothetical protein A5676_04385 [Mycobacterium malmoense]